MVILLYVGVLSICFVNATATTEIYTYCHTLSRHDALPIWPHAQAWHSSRRRNGTLQKRAFGYSRRGCGNRLAIRRCERLRRCERTSLQAQRRGRSEEHTSELQSLMRISYAVFCLKKKKNRNKRYSTPHH